MTYACGEVKDKLSLEGSRQNLSLRMDLSGPRGGIHFWFRLGGRSLRPWFSTLVILPRGVLSGTISTDSEQRPGEWSALCVWDSPTQRGAALNSPWRKAVCGSSDMEACGSYAGLQPDCGDSATLTGGQSCPENRQLWDVGRAPS